jgi:hypothetical protein
MRSARDVRSTLSASSKPFARMYAHGKLASVWLTSLGEALGRVAAN